jgi:hypothetical protein
VLRTCLELGSAPLYPKQLEAINFTELVIMKKKVVYLKVARGDNELYDSHASSTI